VIHRIAYGVVVLGVATACALAPIVGVFALVVLAFSAAFRG
jgi:hypothetical protein